MLTGSPVSASSPPTGSANWPGNTAGRCSSSASGPRSASSPPGASWLKIVRHHGLGGAAGVYREVLGNASSPAEAHIISLT
jgi:hypothetical protein